MSTPPDAFPDEESVHETPQETEQLSSEPLDAPEEGEQPGVNEALPPEAQGETHGGPLGCCLGTVAGLFLMALLTTGIPLLLARPGFLPSTIALILSLVAAVFCGILGWRIGKRVYREYDLSPRQKQKLAAWEKRRVAQGERKGRQKLGVPPL